MTAVDDPLVVAATPPPAQDGSLAYNPALDGIRGLAVAAVLLFHHGVGWARGGYLGVSTFFTLSGFLITSLLVAEHTRSGRVRLSAFWARRLRRLLPASSLTLLGIAGLALVLDQPWERSLRGDLLAGVGQVANWRFLLGERSYGELFSDPSPVLHFWSLAIEEQFYWVFPLVTFAVLVWARASLWTYGAVLVGGWLASAAYGLALGADNSDTVYYSTFTRMAEILAGAALAVAFALANTHKAALLRHRLVAWMATALGAACLLVSLWAWKVVDQTDAGLYRGGLLAYAVVSAGLVAAAMLSPGLKTVVGWEPLRLLGLVSYGAYLFHWPIFLVLDSDRTGLPAAGWQLGLLRVAVTLGAAAASYVLLERPIRRGVWPTAKAGGWTLKTVATVGAVAVLLPVVSPPPEPYDPVAAALEAAEERVKAVPKHVPRAVFFGDSSVLLVAGGVGAWGLETESMPVAGVVGELGCGIGRGGTTRQYGKTGHEPEEDRCDWSETWPEEIEDHTDPDPRIAVILTGVWDIVDRKPPGERAWVTFGDPDYDAFMRDEMGDATDLLLDRGMKVVWLTTPPLDMGRNQEPRPRRDPADADERVEQLNQLIRDVAATRPSVAVVDLHAYFAELSPEEDVRVRPDGVHLVMGTADEIGSWLGPQILAAAESLPEPDGEPSVSG